MLQRVTALIASIVETLLNKEVTSVQMMMVLHNPDCGKDSQTMVLINPYIASSLPY